MIEYGLDKNSGGADWIIYDQSALLLYNQLP